MRISWYSVVPLTLATRLVAQQPEPPGSPWNITVGAAAFVTPRYPGSDEYRVLPLPMVQISYLDRVFLGPSASGTGGGVSVSAIRTSRFRLAAGLGVQDGRPADRADALAGTADRDLVATAGASLTYRTGLLEWHLGATQGLNDSAGFLGNAGVSVSRHVGRFLVRGGVGATMADRKQMRRDFGVTDVEATTRQALIASGDPRLDPEDGMAYHPDGGLHHVTGSLSLIYLLSPRWSLLATGGMDLLSDQATESPLVRQREQVSAGLGLAFRF